MHSDIKCNRGHSGWAVLLPQSCEDSIYLGCVLAIPVLEVFSLCGWKKVWIFKLDLGII